MTDELVLTRRALSRATLARQMLLQRAAVKPVAAIERLAGMQAQLPRPPFIGLWSRVEGFEREDLLRSIRRGDVVRATLMRATLHLVSRHDYATFREALHPALKAASPAKHFEMDTLIAIAREFFAEPRTFDEFRKHLATQFAEGDHRRMAYAIRLNLPLIQAADESPWGYHASAKFQVVPHSDAASGIETLVTRYLAAFGPASVNDMQIWSGLRGLRAVFDRMRPKLATFRDENGKELFDLRKAPRPDEDTPAPVRFLPEYDNLVLAYADRTRIVPEKYKARMLTSKNLVVPPSFLVDGFVAGTWRVEKKKVKLEPFEKLAKKVLRELQDEAERLECGSLLPP